MSDTAQKRIESLRRKNVDGGWTNHDLYRLLYKEELYIAAYEKIKSKPGNMTAGTDKETLDGFSLNLINHIIAQMKDESFQFKPSRRVYIDKANGKKRPLGIPSPRDKIVQEVIKMILESIYDSPYKAYFLDSSHGFRPGRGTHTALEHIRTNWTGTKWIIEGDIESYFDSIEQHILINLLRKKINDERFINLLWKAMRAGYMEFHPRTSFKESLIGTPQGSIISPILANIYLHELDMKLLEIMERENSGYKRRVNQEYSQLQGKIQNAKKSGNKEEVKGLIKLRGKTPCADPYDPNFVRIKYVRYADDWIVGVTGPESLAVSIKEEIKLFLKQKLKLTLSKTKTKITHANTDEALFLGVLVSTRKPSVVRNKGGKHSKRRFSTGRTRLRVPTAAIVKSLAARNFCNHIGEPKANPAWLNYADENLIKLYSSMNRGLLNYYRFANNFASLSRIQYILQHSLAYTLARKHKCRMWKIFKKYGSNIKKVLHNGKAIEFHFCQDWKIQPMAFNTRKDSPAQITDIGKTISRSKICTSCAICGSKQTVEMHHVKYIRKTGQQPTGFTKIMRHLNRKQIPVCVKCHQMIHNGDFDDLTDEEFESIVKSTVSPYERLESRMR